MDDCPVLADTIKTLFDRGYGWLSFTDKPDAEGSWGHLSTHMDAVRDEPEQI